MQNQQKAKLYNSNLLKIRFLTKWTLAYVHRQVCHFTFFRLLNADYFRSIGYKCRPASAGRSGLPLKKITSLFIILVQATQKSAPSTTPPTQKATGT
jgi:hypothetical protein